MNQIKIKEDILSKRIMNFFLYKKEEWMAIEYINVWILITTWHVIRVYNFV